MQQCCPSRALPYCNYLSPFPSASQYQVGPPILNNALPYYQLVYPQLANGKALKGNPQSFLTAIPTLRKWSCKILNRHNPELQCNWKGRWDDARHRSNLPPAERRGKLGGRMRLEVLPVENIQQKHCLYMKPRDHVQIQ